MNECSKITSRNQLQQLPSQNLKQRQC